MNGIFIYEHTFRIGIERNYRFRDIFRGKSVLVLNYSWEHGVNHDDFYSPVMSKKRWKLSVGNHGMNRNPKLHFFFIWLWVSPHGTNIHYANSPSCKRNENKDLRLFSARRWRRNWDWLTADRNGNRYQYEATQDLISKLVHVLHIISKWISAT